MGDVSAELIESIPGLSYSLRRARLNRWHQDRAAWCTARLIVDNYGQLCLHDTHEHASR